MTELKGVIRMRKFCMLLCILCCLSSTVGCKAKSVIPETPDEPEIPPIKVETVKDAFEKNYVYMWNKSGVGGPDKIVNFQTEQYAMQSDAAGGKLVSIGAYSSSVKDIYGEADFDSLIKIKNMSYYVEDGGAQQKFKYQDGYNRVIESGRYIQKIDYNSLRISSSVYFNGRFEISAMAEHAALNYEVHNGYSDRNLTLQYEMEFGETMSSQTLDDNRGILVTNTKGVGILFVKPKTDSGLKITFSDNKVTFLKENVFVPAGTYGGFGVIIIPKADAVKSDLSKIADLENVTVLANQINPKVKPQTVIFDDRRGVFEIETGDISVGYQDSASNRNNYERVQFSIENVQDKKMKVLLSFVKPSGSSAYSSTGISPMIRDKDSLEPTGTQVQISKNWHFDPSANIAGNAPSRYLEGNWYRGSALIEVAPKSIKENEYTCAYGSWGGVYAASHAQLCLIGWGGANNLLWDESALGSWGESITYDPDMGLGRSMIDDIRPFLVKSPQSNNALYNWTGNVGGANFLDYYPQTKQEKIINQKVTYSQQAPNLTDVKYSGVTSDGAIKSDIKINMGRTDDVVRAYYTVKYEFAKDTEFTRLSLFKMAADGYADNSYRKFALGDETGVKNNDVLTSSLSVGYQKDAFNKVQASSQNFWYMMYDSTDPYENGDTAMVVRAFDATINGKNYDKPTYSIFGTNNGKQQPSCELTIPSEAGNIIKQGSKIEMKIEYLVLPSNNAHYYGSADYMTSSDMIPKYGKSDFAYNQVIGGLITAKASVGKVTGNYPVSIACDLSSNTVAQFELSGGLGYVPIRFDNMAGYSGYKLQVNSGIAWEDLVQVGSKANKNDFFQTYFNANNNSFSRSYNVKNTNGLNYNSVKEYRMVKSA